MQELANEFGTVEYQGKTYTLCQQADFSNRMFVGWWGSAQEGEPYTTEFCAKAFDDNGDEYRVYWQFDTVKGQEPHENDLWPWDNEHISQVRPE